MRRFLSITTIAIMVVAGGIFTSGVGSAPPAQPALAKALEEAKTARARAERFEKEARKAEDDAIRARRQADALLARIEESEAGITAAEARLAEIEKRRAEQRARLARQQEPLVRLTAALQMMARRPSALAFIQPGSLDDTIHVRSVLASTLPVIEVKTASLRQEIQIAESLRAEAEKAVGALVQSQKELEKRRIRLAKLEARQKMRSEQLGAVALYESDRAIAFGEKAREIAAEMRSQEFQTKVQQSLAALPGPLLRPVNPPKQKEGRSAPYLLPVEGRVVVGMGEISDAGVHSRGITLSPPAGAQVVAPRAGRVVFADRFRGYGKIIIIDHGDGWASVITDLAALNVERGDRIARGTVIGRAASETPQISVELRYKGRAFPIASVIMAG